MIYIIEHLEEELSEWSMIEYRHISRIVGKENLWFTNLKGDEMEALSGLGEVYKESVADMGLKDAIVLDPGSDKILAPGDSSHSYLIFGGILGDHPPQKRTQGLASRLDCEARNLGNGQMSTDTAVNVAHRIMQGATLGELKFADDVAIKMNENEEVELPFRFLVENGKPVIAPGLLKHLKKKESF